MYHVFVRRSRRQTTNKKNTTFFRKRKREKMEKPTATPRPEAEATSSNSSKTVANNVSAKRASTITGFFQNVGVSHTNSLPDYCNNKNFYSNIIRHALKPDQVLRGRLTCILTVTPALGVTNFPLFFSNSSFFFFFLK